tara:strand:- start:21 stop:779 length:759 start_codon:yes stop_codon:yes gene_type:complete
MLLLNHGYGIYNSEKKFTPNILKPTLNTNAIIDIPKESSFESSLSQIYKYCKIYNQNSLFLGGDHSISIATISAIYKPNMKIIWIDSRPNINTNKASTTGNKNDMPLAYLTGIEKSKYNINLPFEDILYIGIEDISSFENNIIDKHNIKYIKSSASSKIIKKEILNFCDGQNVHISFDVGVLNNDAFNSCNTHVNNGFSILKMKYIFDTLYLNCNINSMDIVEINFIKSLSSEIFEDYETLKVLFSKYNIFN